MIDFQYDDGGRLEAGYKGQARDCVVRAYCILTGEDYRAMYKVFAKAQGELTGGPVSARNGIVRAVSRPMFEALGLQKIKLGRGKRPTFTEAYNLYGDCIVSTTRHLCALVNGALRDTADCRTYLFPQGHTIRCVQGRQFFETPELRERKARTIWIKQSQGE